MQRNRLKEWIYTICAAAALLYKPCIIPIETLNGLAESVGPVEIFLEELRACVYNNGMLDLMLFGALLPCVSRFYGKKRVYKRQSFALASLFSIFMIIGKSMYYADGIYMACFSSFAKLLLMILSAVGYMILFVPAVDIFIDHFLQYQEKNLSAPNSCFIFIFDRHPVLCTSMIMAVCELPYWIFFYPGSTMGDGIAQLTMYYGMNALSNHHPVLSTLCMGMLNDFGRMIGNNNFGLFCYTFLQSVIQIFVFSMVFAFAKKYHLPYFIRAAVLAFFTIFSVWHVYSITLVKDSAFYIAFLLFFLTVTDYWMQGADNWKIYLRLFFAGFTVWAFRNNGYYVVLISLFVLLFKDYKKIRFIKILALMVLFVGINSGYHNIFLPFAGAAEGSVREMLSVPIQQTARYCKYYSNEVSGGEKEVIESIFSCSVETLGERYNPELSNPIKEIFNIEQASYNLSEYFKVWVKQGARHPLVYIDALFYQCYGYIYPDKDVFDVISYYEIEGGETFTEEMKEFQLHQLDVFTRERRVIMNFENMISRLPVVNYLFHCGSYTWVLLLLIMVLVSGKLYKDCLVGIPLLVVLGINCISPVNAYMRYQLPLMAAVPVFLMFVMCRCLGKSNTNDMGITNE